MLGFGIKDFVSFPEWGLQKCSATIEIISFVILLGMSLMVTQDFLLRMDSFVVFGQASEADLPGAARFSSCLQAASPRSDFREFPMPGLPVLSHCTEGGAETPRAGSWPHLHRDHCCMAILSWHLVLMASGTEGFLVPSLLGIWYLKPRVCFYFVHELEFLCHLSQFMLAQTDFSVCHSGIKHSTLP